MSAREDNKITDKSGDRKYFVMTPRIVWALCENPLEYTLWSVVKDVAGDDGECYLSTDDLAILSMMSTGSVSKWRKSLIKKGLMSGELRRDPGYPQPVWHLEITDVWKDNIEWCSKNSTIKSRVLFKLEQVELARIEEKEPSPDEGGVSPDEGGVSPDETKNIHKENPLVEPEATPLGAQPAPSEIPLGIDWQMAQGAKQIQLPTQEQQLQAEYDFACMGICRGAKNLEPLAMAFIQTRKLIPTKTQYKSWRVALQTMNQAKPNPVQPEHLIQAIQELEAWKPGSVIDPFSPINKAISIANPSGIKPVQKNPAVTQEEFRDTLQEWIIKRSETNV